MNPTHCWIWYPGDFEIRHALKLHARRQERDYVRPAFWPVYDCWHSARFFRHAELAAPEGLTVQARGKGNVCVDGKLYPFGEEIPLSAGSHEIMIDLCREDGLPCLYVENGSLSGTEGWMVHPFAGEKVPVGSSPLFTRPEQDPEVFPFVYEEIHPVEIVRDERGTLYDFGRETFARVFLELEDQPAFSLCFGESETEARDTSACLLMESIPAGTRSLALPARAFRYVFLPNGVQLSLRAEYERTPLERRGRFSCSDSLLTDIWNTAAYTFELNSREFFLDGIKRDRWVWSGDAYQSFFVSRFLYMDADICHRTLWALRGKEPLLQHLNSIVDYSLYWLLAIREDYQTYGDPDFVRAIWPRMQSLTDFCLGRTNEEGFLIGREEDWVFMDWADMDKDGPLCAEQMLFIRALEAAADCALLAGQDGSRYAAHAETLAKKLDAFFYDEEKGAYIDTYASGRRNVTRHANIFAILYDFADEAKRASIVRNVLDNDAVPAITTPYFKFFELWANCKLGRVEKMLDQVRDYWGGMLTLGATTIWEEYDPRQTFPDHYAMYGDPYGKSLCHAWGAGPIDLIGRYVVGFRAEAPGCKSFSLEPRPACLAALATVVPLPGCGQVRLCWDERELRVLTDRPGGALIWQGQRFPLTAGQELRLSR